MFGGLTKFFVSLFGSRNKRLIRAYSAVVKDVGRFRESTESLTDRQLKEKTTEFKQKLAQGAPSESILAEAFAVVREAADRNGGEVYLTRTTDLRTKLEGLLTQYAFEETTTREKTRKVYDAALQAIEDAKKRQARGVPLRTAIQRLKSRYDGGEDATAVLRAAIDAEKSVAKEPWEEVLHQIIVEQDVRLREGRDSQSLLADVFRRIEQDMGHDFGEDRLLREIEQKVGSMAKEGGKKHGISRRTEQNVKRFRQAAQRTTTGVQAQDNREELSVEEKLSRISEVVQPQLVVPPGIRNIFLDKYSFDASRLSPHAQELYRSLKNRIDIGMSIREIEIPPELYAGVRELYPVSRPPFRFCPFDEQCIGANVLYDGKVAEMATGEGKTLAAVLAAYLVHLTGKKVHIITVNDYLAWRDAHWMGPIYHALGLTVGCIQTDMDTSGEQRRTQYACDITYGTNNEFGFDYLRDNMKTSLESMVQGPLDYAIIDEVDSILIDEARTPLIISGPAFDDVTRYKDADKVARSLIKRQNDYDSAKKHIDTAEKAMAAAQGELTEARKQKDAARVHELERTISRNADEIDSYKARLESATQYYETELDRKSIHLTHEGISAAQEAAGVGSFFTGSNMEWPHMLEQSLRAHVIYHREVDYVVKDGIVIIVDEFTGRLMHGRQWSDGLHQAVEAKEGVQVKEESQTLATITLQNFFKLYGRLAGMTGTAATEAEEFLKIYDLDVVTIPTNRPCARDDREDEIYRTEREKFDAIIDEIYRMSESGRPVLVGTTSIEKSAAIHDALMEKKDLNDDEVEVLNAKQHEREAHIVAKAGQQHQVEFEDGTLGMFGNITIATNMAGRGTDIVLGPSVAALGGLHVLGTERHEARRIDNQLRGRSGRQGDAGSSQFLLSLDDDLIRFFAAEWTLKVLKGLAWEEGQPIYAKMLTRGIERAQKKVEERNFEVRKSLLDYDEVMDHQRKIFYSRRRSILKGTSLKAIIKDMIAGTVNRATESMLAQSYPYDCIVEWARTRFGVDLKAGRISGMEPAEIEERVKSEAVKAAETKIGLSLGEYLEDYEDPATWDVRGLSRWAQTTFNVNLSISKAESMTAEEIEQTLTAAAADSINNRDCSELNNFLEPDYSLRAYVGWAQRKFRLNESEISSAKLRGRNSQDVREYLLKVIDVKYAEREMEYPVNVAMTRTFGRNEPNVYAYQALADWANKKYLAGLTVEDVQNDPAAKTNARLLELSRKCHEGGLEAEVEQAIRANSSESLAAWVIDRFEAKLDVSMLADKTKAKELLMDAGVEFLRRELSNLEKYVLIQVYDTTWKDHLYSMDHLKESIFLRAMAERDPKVEYKHEGFRMFTEMLNSIEEQVTDLIFEKRLEVGTHARTVWNVSQTQHAQVSQFEMSEKQRAAALAPQGEAAKPQTIRVETPKVGRNDPCPCGSGKKYKKCHGAGK